MKIKKIIREELVKATNFYKKSKNIANSNGTQYYFANIKRDQLVDFLREKGKYENKYVRLISYFNALIPQETKTKIKKARWDFSTYNLFFISETKPEEWNIEEGIKTMDPLVIGVKDDKCYLIDKFDTTPLEEYVIQEFTS